MVSRGYIGMMEKKMETTIVNLGVILGLWKRKWADLYWVHRAYNIITGHMRTMRKKMYTTIFWVM